jgi:hypothetical protein
MGIVLITQRAYRVCLKKLLNFPLSKTFQERRRQKDKGEVDGAKKPEKRKERKKNSNKELITFL